MVGTRECDGLKIWVYLENPVSPSDDEVAFFHQDTRHHSEGSNRQITTIFSPKKSSSISEPNQNTQKHLCRAQPGSGRVPWVASSGQEAAGSLHPRQQACCLEDHR